MPVGNELPGINFWYGLCLKFITLPKLQKNNMKNNFKTFSAICLCLLLLAACTKPKDNNTTTSSSDAKQHNQDVSNAKNESDNSNSDVNNAVYNASTFGKTDGTQSLSICGGTVDTTPNVPHSITISYDGVTNCGDRIRSGKLKLSYQDYKVTFTSNSHYITFNGNKYLTDTTGINWFALITTGTLGEIKERSDSMSLTFEDGTSRTWQIARKATYTVPTAYVINATVEADTTIDGYLTDTWGVTRYGTHFVVRVSQPWQSSTACGWWRPTSGTYTCVTDNFTLTATLGVNASGVQINSGCLAYGYKLDWTISSNNSTGEAILPYW